MKIKYLLLAVMVACLFLDVSAEKKIRKRKKLKSSAIVAEIQPAPSQIVNQETEDIEISDNEKDISGTEEPESNLDEVAQQILFGYRHTHPNENIIEDNPCGHIQCSAGMVCDIDKDGEPVCNCIPECPYEVEERRHVCTNHNETFDSDCEVHRQRCICMKGLDGCKGEEYKHVQVEYYGSCKEMPECTQDEISDFPRRMRDWLYYIMRDLADRHELSEYYMQLEKESANNFTRGWINAAIWKWCDLDADDNNRFVSRHELFPIRAPLMALEHCISPFLDSCDYNDDHRITLLEWGKCLELDESELTERCENLSEDNEKI